MRGTFSSIAAVAALLAFAPACRHRPPEGPGERAGRAVDNAAHKASEATKDAVHETKRDVDGR